MIARMAPATLAEKTETTRPRVSLFMRIFEVLGFVDYHGEREVHSLLRMIILPDSRVSNYGS
jgi:hypothetical protein